ncbi:MAG: glycosyltransferase [Anaerolineales bacterium]|nr:glycosyltransferase [Anaerolineales bacterium]
MRIGMLSDIYKPHVSGVTHYITLNKQFLENMGHEVFVFTFGDVGHEDEEERVIRTAGVPVPVSDSGIHLGFRYSKSARELIRTMDLVHVHHPFLSGRLALRYCRPEGIPIVFTNHTRYDLYAQAYLPMLPDQVGTTFLQSYLPSFCSEVDLVIAPSEGLKRVLRELGVEGSIEVIPNGVDLTPFEEDRRPVPRKELDIPEDHVVLVYTGRLGPEKNLTFLLRSFAGTQSAWPETTLMLVGRGSEKENLEDFAAKAGLEDHVVFTGLVDYDEVPRYLAAADAFVTASVTEVHPLSVIEAMASGLPVVGIESPGVGDIVRNGHNGLLAAHDLAAFTAKLTRMVSDRETRQRLTENAAQSAQQYDIQRTAPKVEEHYRRLVAEPRQRKEGLWQRVVSGLRRVMP